ncbi:hypothetical protein BDF19DRAFT_382349, partial [Syncephalis fuscata]
MPYWDWSAVSQSPETSVVLSPEWFGTNGRGPKMCVEDGVFKDFKPYFHAPEHSDCIHRQYDGGNVIKPMPSTDIIAGLVANSKNWDEFRRELEGAAHGRTHNGLGGTMSTMFSPNDPVFYMHHTYLDKIWYDWQKIDPEKRVYQFYG